MLFLLDVFGLEFSPVKFYSTNGKGASSMDSFARIASSLLLIVTCCAWIAVIAPYSLQSPSLIPLHNPLTSSSSSTFTTSIDRVKVIRKPEEIILTALTPQRGQQLTPSNENNIFAHLTLMKTPHINRPKTHAQVGLYS